MNDIEWLFSIRFWPARLLRAYTLARGFLVFFIVNGALQLLQDLCIVGLCNVEHFLVCSSTASTAVG